MLTKFRLQKTFLEVNFLWEERINDDGSAEQLIGCRVCGAMCTITYNKDLRSAVSDDEPRKVLSIAEAPQPNPWMELGSFDDCKAGK